MISYEPNQKAEDVVYAAAFVLNMPVLMTGRTLVNIPAEMEAVTLAPHVTLSYNPTQEFLDKLTMGQEFDVNVLKILADESAIVAHVSLPEDIPFENDFPHLTVALGSDVNAVYSNELLTKFYQGDPDVGEMDMSRMDGLKVGISPGNILVKVGTWRRQSMPVAEPVTMAVAHE